MYCITFVALISLLHNFSNLDNCYERQLCWNPYFVIVQFVGFILVAVHVLDWIVGQENPPKNDRRLPTFVIALQNRATTWLLIGCPGWESSGHPILHQLPMLVIRWPPDFSQVACVGNQTTSWFLTNCPCW